MAVFQNTNRNITQEVANGTGTSSVVGNLYVTANVNVSEDVNITGNGYIGGNLVVDGNVSYINIETLNVQDPIIELGRGPNGAPLANNDGKDRGMEMWYYTSAEHAAFVGRIDSTGNIISAANVSVANEVVTVNNYGTFQTGTVYSSSILTTTFSAAGNVTGGNLLTGGLVSAAGTITSAANVIGGNLTTVGQVSAGSNITGGNILTGGVVSSSGNITGANIYTPGLVTATGNVVGSNVVTAGQVTAGANVVGANLVTAGQVTATGNVTTSASVNAARGITAGNQTFTKVSNNNGEIQLDNGSADTPGVSFYYNNGTNYGIDANNNKFRLVYNLNEAGGTELLLADNAANISALGNVLVAGQTSTTGNVTGGNILTSGVVSAGSITTGGAITAAGNIAAGNIAAGNIQVTGQVSATIYYDYDNTSYYLDPASTSNLNNLSLAGRVVAGSGSAASPTYAFSADGGVDTGFYWVGDGYIGITNNGSQSGILGPGTLSMSGNVTGGNFVTAGLVSATGNVYGANLVGVVRPTAGTGTNGIVFPADPGGGSGDLATIQYYASSGENTVLELAVTNDATDIIKLNASGGVSVVGGLTADGNISSGSWLKGANISTGGNVLVDGYISVVGNLYVANVVSSANLVVQDPLVYLTANSTYPYNYDIGLYSQFTGGSGNTYQHTGFVRDYTDGVWKLFSNVGEPSGTVINFTDAIYDPIKTGNIDAASAALSGSVSATGNITGGNILTSGLISSTGNYITTGVVFASKFYDVDNSSYYVDPASTSLVNSIDALGFVSATGNVNGGNLIVTGGIASVSGNITGGNILTAGLISSTGNATHGNILTSGLVSAAANITGGNILTSGLISATGNITGGNLSVTGNVSGNTNGFSIGYLNIPQVSFAANTTTAASDAAKHYYSTSASNLSLTIANNSSVSWAVGTTITVVNRGTGTITIGQDTGVSLYMAGNASSGNRSITSYGMATVINVASNTWVINGTGVS